MAEKAIEQAIDVLEELESHGHKAFIVGGAVRDSLLNLPIHDVDIATSATPYEVISIFPDTIPVGIEHGTVIVRHNNIDYEVTTFRSESDYKDFRHPETVIFEKSIEKDLARRDFTVNAIAMDKHMNKIDPYKGQEDLEKRVLNSVGDPSERFEEDPLRILRAARFISQLNFEPNKELLKAIVAKKMRIAELSIERINQEMTKLLSRRWPTHGLEILHETGALFILPGLECLKPETSTYVLTVKFKECATTMECWSAFLLALSISSPKNLLKKWRFSKKEANFIIKLIDDYGLYSKKKWDLHTIYTIGIEQALAIERLKSALHNKDEENVTLALELHRSLPINSRDNLKVNGHDLQAWLDQKPGPWIQELMKEIEMKVIYGELKNETLEIKKWVQTCHKQRKKY